MLFARVNCNYPGLQIGARHLQKSHRLRYYTQITIAILGNQRLSLRNVDFGKEILIILSAQSAR